MLISRLEDEMSAEDRQESDAHEYQTASELFDIMAKNHPFEEVSESLSTRDLVILYKNIDIGTKLMSNAEEYKLNIRPNQYVETIVYNEDPDSEGSDSSEIYCNEDLNNVIRINKERIEMLNCRPSLENTLCQKLGDLEIQASNISFRYDQHFLFKDPYIKEQLKNLSHIGGEFEGSALPSSLLDYICCKRLEDNYNFYMDNIIRYVKHTIEQLKRISNGDYLTDRAKEKWREVEDVREEDNSKVLATSTSIPLQVERKVNGLKTSWDDIIHSEVDIRSLSKILEKKIIVEVPKLICGSYKLFSKLCSDNLVISCKKDKQVSVENEKESRVDVVLQLGRSETGQVMSNISSIMILQPPSPVLSVECPKILPLTFIQNEQVKDEKKNVQIIEIPEIKQEQFNDSVNDDSNETNGAEICNDASIIDDIDDINFFDKSKNDSLESGDSSVALKDILDTRAIPDILRKEAPYNFISPDDLSLSMHRLNMSSLPEESGEDTNLYPINKKKSQTKARIKSPYENKSHAIEEKKRKKLLEIRERREKKKMAVGENCKITKHRYGKGAIMPQPSSSVTKLSITNKSFYNSIYGQNINMNMEKQLNKNKGRRSKRELMIDTPLDQLEGELDSPLLTPDKNNKKYINRSYYLDEAVTEMMYTDMKPSECGSVREMFSGTPSAISGDLSANMSIISQIVNLPESKEINSIHRDTSSFDDLPESDQETNQITFKASSRSILNIPAPTNSPKGEDEEGEDLKKPLPSIECRKSIDKLYDLMKKIRKVDLGLKSSRSKLFANESKLESKGGLENSTVQGSDSGTSLKHHLTSSNPSSFSFEKIHNPDENIPISLKNTSNKKTDALTTVVPKVIISSKQQTVKVEVERTRKDRKKVAMNPLSKVPDNPLKAISQLLHEFDSVQKTRHRPSTDPKPIKKPDTPFDRNVPRPGPSKRRLRFDQPLREREVKEREMTENDAIDAKNVKEFAMKERKLKPNVAIEPLKIPHQLIPLEEKHFDRATRKKITDILDEAKEAKGEAVRGPTKFNSRLNSLAQPKKSYVQAHSEEYQTRYGRNLMADRLQRLASPPQQAGPARIRPRRTTTEAASSVSVRPPPLQSLERERPGRPRAGSSPAASGRPRRDSDPPDTLKTKMVAVESYVKSHYGRSSPSPPGELLKARVPLVPTDLDIASVPSSPTGEESTVLGNKLHYMINSMISSKPSPLGALLEARETSSKTSREKDDMISLSMPDYIHEHASSIDSDYRADIFEDKNVKTAVESFEDKPDEPVAEVDSNKSFVKYEEDSCNSSMEIQKLEEALNGRVSVTTFQKRLRIKNFTLTPKHSKQQVLVFESGDAGSIVLKSTLSKSLKMSYSRSNEDVRSLANLVDPHLDWNFSNIPLQVATVGYAFPEYNSAFSGPSSAIKSLDNIFNLGRSANVAITEDSNKIRECIGRMPKPRSKHRAPDVVVTCIKNTEVAVSSPSAPKNEKEFITLPVATEAYIYRDEGKNEDCPNLSDVEKLKKDIEIEMFKDNQDNVDSTSSLDMLVGLLNEIQKITTCHMTNADIYADENECIELEAILSKDGDELKKTVKNSSSRELVSIASLEKLRQLESSPSIYSLYLSNEGKESAVNSMLIPRLSTSAKSVLCNNKPCCVDKEVSADFTAELTNTYTDVPSKFFPMTFTTSTNITNSLLGILSKPSSHSAHCLQEYDDVDSLFTRDKIIKITEETTHNEQLMIQYPKASKINTKIKCNEIFESKKSSKLQKVSTELIPFSDQNKCGVKSCDFDPMIKMKRDILVTVYSMLVLTVFAALSFPEIMYHV